MFAHLDDNHQRQSSSFTLPQSFQDFMDYASHCKDQLDVYWYMQENQIGINQPTFWLAVLNILKRTCQFKLILKKLNQLKKNSLIKQHRCFYKILDFEQDLTIQLQQQIRRRRGKKRRSMKQFELFSISKIQKNKRKVGGIQIYVDQDCRQNYKLQDYSQFFINNLQDQIQSRKYQYQRKQNNKPLSFLGVKQSNMDKWSLQLIQMKKRNSQLNQMNQNRLSSNNHGDHSCSMKRFSVSKKSNLLQSNNNNNPEINYKTPKQKRMQTPKKVIYTVSKQKDILQTPKQQTIRLKYNQSILKSYKKSQNIKKPNQDQNQIDDNMTQLQRQILGLQSDQFDNFPQYKQLIRQKRQINDDIQKFTYIEQSIQQVDNNNENIFYMRQNRLNIASLDLSGTQQMKMQIQQDFDNKLHDTILMVQIQTLINVSQQSLIINNNKQQLGSQQSPISNQTCYGDSQYSDQSSIVQTNIIYCIKSTQTMESIDSNQQNIFTAKKIINQSHQELVHSNIHPNAFRKDRKAFQLLNEDDLNMISINDSSQNNIQIQNNNNNQIMSAQDTNQIKSIILQIDQCKSSRISQPNLVLQTMRKKKLTQARTHLMEKQHIQSTNSQKKNIIHLSYISEESSYNSQRKFNSNQRFSKGFDKDFDDFLN